MKADITRQEAIGMLALVGAVSLFSTVEVASKRIPEGIDPFLLVFFRFFCTGIVLLMAAYLGGRREILQRLEPRDFLVFFVNGTVGIALAISLFHFAIHILENAASSAVVFSVNPVFVTLLARFVNGESWTVRKWAAATVGAVGVLCFAWESGRLTSSSVTGLGVMLSSAMLFALSICISKRYMDRYGPLILMGFSGLIGGILVFPVALLRTDPATGSLLAESWPIVAFVVFGGTTLAYGLYYFGLGCTSASKASLSFFLKPVLASLLAVSLGESTNIAMIGGTALILGGLCLAVVVPEPRKATV